MERIREQSGLTLAVFLCALSSLFLLSTGSAFAQNEANDLSHSSSATQLHHALALAQRGDRQGAMTLALQMLERDPRFVPAMKLEAMLLEETGQAAQAGVIYGQALNLAPNDPDLLLKTGIYLLKSGDKEKALELLQHCARINPSDGDAQYYLAQAYQLNGQDKLALGAIRQSLKRDPNNASVWQKYGELLCETGDCEGGLRWLLKAQHADRTLPRIDFDIATTDYKMMDLTGAAQFAGHAVAAQSGDASAWQLLATANLKLAHWQEAETAFEQRLSLTPDDVESLLGLGQCQVELKNYSIAVDTLHSVLRQDPTRLLAHYYLSRAFRGMGREQDAQHEAALHQLMMEHATFVRSAANDERESAIKPQARKMLAAGQEDRAFELYQQHFKGSSATSADAYVFIGKLYLFMGKTEDGLRCLHHALKLQPDVRGAHTYEGILALRDHDLGRAEQEFQADLAGDPSYQLAIAELGEVRYHQQRWSEAAEQLAKSRTTTPELLYMLCDAYFHLGKVEEANLNAEAMAAYARNKPDVMLGLVDLLRRNGQSELAQRLQAE
jgi:tetratricopeptide (TPR) repeat protein